MTKNLIVQYIRDNDRHPIGCLVAVRQGDSLSFNVGWSLCRKGDKFNRHEAIGRALGRTNSNDMYPHSVRKAIPSFQRNIDEAVEKIIKSRVQ
jgi:hypothetical protein